MAFNFFPVLLDSSITCTSLEDIAVRPLVAVLAFLVISVIAVNIPSCCSKVTPFTDSAEDTLPRLFAKSAELTA